MSEETNGQNDSVRLTDEDLDLVETDRLIAALGRRYQALIICGLEQPESNRYIVVADFLPNFVACAGIMELLQVSHDLQMRRMRRATAQEIIARDHK